MKALSIRQPWAWLIANGHKDLENRSWKTHLRGRILIHAAKGMSRDEYAACEQTLQLALAIDPKPVVLPSYEQLQRGGIIGSVEITGCVTKHRSPWFFGDYGFVLAHAQPLPFRPCRGALGFFEVPSL
jgi:hypothetical protein